MSITEDADSTRRVALDVRVDALRTLSAVRLSAGDPTAVVHGDTVWKALRTTAGAATVAARQDGPDAAMFWAWGPGADAALGRAPEWLGVADTLESFDPTAHPRVAELAQERRAVRMGRFGLVAERLVPTIFGQLVIGKEAKRSYRGLVERFGEPAPGPVPLQLAPTPEVLVGLGSHDFHQVGVERKRAAIVQRAAREAARLDRLVDAPLDEAYRMLRHVRGIGPWTAASVGRVAFGDPDAVIVGDYNLPHLVAWQLAGKRRATDEEMLALLEPFAGHRGRVQALLKAGGAKPPRHGPRNAFRAIERH